MNNQKDMKFLGKSFNELPQEGKHHLKDFLEGLLALQKSLLGSAPLVKEPANKSKVMGKGRP
ncbi:hypothetical protein LQZ19_09530 [Treponema primitia]|uniref:hypothetical protein n=1 Tax=Treponema primitia TaxID=88058 RepID=UPI00398130E2